jgi:hypothetical protein
MDHYSTHQLVLLEVLKRISKPILELGAGDYSTPQIHAHGGKILTIDDSREWIDKYSKLKTKSHAFCCFDNIQIQKFYDNDREDWGLVFIDNGTWEARNGAVKKYKDTADYVIMHDCDYYPKMSTFGKEIHPMNFKARDMGIRTYSDIFKYWVEFFVQGWKEQYPPTLVGSNKINLKDLVVEGMTVCGRR